MDKRRIKTTLNKIRALKTWQLLILLVLTFFVMATALRMNNVGMIRRREAVISADASGDREKALKATQDLANYAYSHMNSGGILYIEGGGWKIERNVRVIWEKIYEADYQKAMNEASAKMANNPNGNIYKKTAEICDPINTGYNRAYFDCFWNELQKYSGEDYISGTQVQIPDPNEYTFTFISPIWTPDIAGWTILVAILIVFLIIFKLIFEGILRLMLKKHKPFI